MVEMCDAVALKELVTTWPDADSMDNFDHRLVRLILPVVEAISKHYFRAEVEGIDQVPEGTAMIVGNHNAGITFLEPFMMGAVWYRTRGEDERLFFLAHDAMVAIPFMRNLLLKFGCIRATMENSKKLLAEGQKIVVFPGGNYEAFRKFSERKKVDFGGHKGFAKLAVETDTPIVPMLSTGGHETFIVLHRGEKLAKLTRTDKILRSRSFPIALALPWGVMVGPMFHLPLPVKLKVQFGEPFKPSEIVKGRASAQKKIEAVYDESMRRIQKMMDTCDPKYKDSIM